MGKISIEAIDLSVGYKSKGQCTEVIGHLNFSIETGTLLCLIGRNGSGKSTLLRTLANLQAPLHGTIMLEGENVAEMSTSKKATTYAVVLTDSVADSGLTVYQIVALSRTPYIGYRSKLTEQDASVVSNAIEEVNLWSKKDKKLTELSDGERQRVLIAKALAQETKIIFLDEPTSHLDLVNRHEIMLLLHSLCRRKGRTIIMSTHEIELSLQIADRLIILNKEEDCIQGIPEDLVLNGDLQAVFNHKSVLFDPNMGLFRMNHNAMHSVSLMSRGEGIMTFWTRQVLRRNSFAVTNDAQIKITVDERRHFWTLDYNDVSNELFSLEELLMNLLKCKQENEI